MSRSILFCCCPRLLRLSATLFLVAPSLLAVGFRLPPLRMSAAWIVRLFSLSRTFSQLQPERTALNDLEFLTQFALYASVFTALFWNFSNTAHRIEL